MPVTAATWQQEKAKLKTAGIKVDIFKEDFSGKITSANKALAEYRAMFGKPAQDPKKLDAKRVAAYDAFLTAKGIGGRYIVLLENVSTKATPAQKVAIKAADGTLVTMCSKLDIDAKGLAHAPGTAKDKPEKEIKLKIKPGATMVTPSGKEVKAGE